MAKMEDGKGMSRAGGSNKSSMGKGSMGRQGSKDPMPTGNNTGRDGKDGGGNTPVTGEKHDGRKGETVPETCRFNKTFEGNVNEYRPMGGNTCEDGSGEAH